MIGRTVRPGLALIAALASFWVAVASCAPADDPVVAKLNGGDLKLSDIRHVLDGLTPAAREKATASSQALLDLVRAEMGRRAVLSEAERTKWDQRPEIAARIEQARSDVIVSTYITSVAKPAAAPTDDQIKKLYEANASRFMQPRRYHLAQIYVALPANATPAEIDAARTKAQDVAKRAKAPGADFDSIARNGSDDKASAGQGGDLGWLAESTLVPAIAAAVQGMSDNEISGPIEAKDGWHIVRELGTKAAGPASLDEVRPTLVNTIRQQEATAAAQIYVEKLLDKDKAAVNQIELNKLIANPVR